MLLFPGVAFLMFYSFHLAVTNKIIITGKPPPSSHPATDPRPLEAIRIYLLEISWRAVASQKAQTVSHTQEKSVAATVAAAPAAAARAGDAEASAVDVRRPHRVRREEHRQQRGSEVGRQRRDDPRHGQPLLPRALPPGDQFVLESFQEAEDMLGQRERFSA